MMIVSLAGMASLAVLVDEPAEVVWADPNFTQAYFSYRETWQDSTGNDFTGVATALLFGAAMFPVVVDLISRAIIRHVPVEERVKGFIRRINSIQRKYLMPLHTYLSIIALGLGILHLILLCGQSSSRTGLNPVRHSGGNRIAFQVEGCPIKVSQIPLQISYQPDCLRSFTGHTVCRSCCNGFGLTIITKKETLVIVPTRTTQTYNEKTSRTFTEKHIRSRHC
jgi:hypothetical protein